MIYFEIRLQAIILVSLLLIGVRIEATAQAPAPTAPARADSGALVVENNWYLPAYRPQRAPADSAGALLYAFARKRTAGWAFTLPWLAGMTLALPISTHDAYGNQTAKSAAISPPIGVTVLLGGVVGFVAHANRYSKARLRGLSQAYAAGSALPPTYRQVLQAKDFEKAALLRTALRQQIELDKRRPAR